MKQTTIIFMCLVMFVLAGIATHLEAKNTKSRRRELTYYKETYSHKQGATAMLGDKTINYHLQSFDGGKIWYATEHLEDDGVKILGLAEEIFPGLLAHLASKDALIVYTKTNGPITSSQLSSPAVQQFLTNAGFGGASIDSTN